MYSADADKPFTEEFIVDEETKALVTAVCAQDDLPAVKDVRFATYLPFLARP